MSFANEQFTVVAPKYQTTQDFVDKYVRKEDDFVFECVVCGLEGYMSKAKIAAKKEELNEKGIDFRYPNKHDGECKVIFMNRFKNNSTKEKVVEKVVEKAPAARVHKEDEFPPLPVGKKKAQVVTKSKELLELETELENLRREAENREREAPLIAAAKAEIAKLKAARPKAAKSEETKAKREEKWGDMSSSE